MSHSWMRAVLTAFVGLLSYLFGIRTLVYLVGFVTGYVVPKTIQEGPSAPAAKALALDTLLFVLFASSHSLMARSGWKEWLRRRFPAALERSLYVLVAAGTLSLLIWQWRPLPRPVWVVGGSMAPLLLVVSVAGWLLAGAGIVTLGNTRLLGLASAWAAARGKPTPKRRLVTRGLYARLRHPVYLGYLIGLWAAPTMSQGRLLLAALSTLYIAVGMRLEERDLASTHGAEYERYQSRVPAFGLRRPRR